MVEQWVEVQGVGSSNLPSSTLIRDLTVIWIWQPDCKSGLSGSGSSPPGPTTL